MNDPPEEDTTKCIIERDVKKDCKKAISCLSCNYYQLDVRLNVKSNKLTLNFIPINPTVKKYIEEFIESSGDRKSLTFVDEEDCFTKFIATITDSLTKFLIKKMFGNGNSTEIATDLVTYPAEVNTYTSEYKGNNCIFEKKNLCCKLSFIHNQKTFIKQRKDGNGKKKKTYDEFVERKKRKKNKDSKSLTKIPNLKNKTKKEKGSLLSNVETQVNNKDIISLFQRNQLNIQNSTSATPSDLFVQRKNELEKIRQNLIKTCEKENNKKTLKVNNKVDIDKGCVIKSSSNKTSMQVKNKQCKHQDAVHPNLEKRNRNDKKIIEYEALPKTNSEQVYFLTSEKTCPYQEKQEFPDKEQKRKQSKTEDKGIKSQDVRKNEKEIKILHKSKNDKKNNHLELNKELSKVKDKYSHENSFNDHIVPNMDGKNQFKILNLHSNDYKNKSMIRKREEHIECKCCKRTHEKRNAKPNKNKSLEVPPKLIPLKCENNSEFFDLENIAFVKNKSCQNINDESDKSISEQRSSFAAKLFLLEGSNTPKEKYHCRQTIKNEYKPIRKELSFTQLNLCPMLDLYTPPVNNRKFSKNDVLKINTPLMTEYKGKYRIEHVKKKQYQNFCKGNDKQSSFSELVTKKERNKLKNIQSGIKNFLESVNRKYTYRSRKKVVSTDRLIEISTKVTDLDGSTKVGFTVEGIEPP